jgi:hypothetical protein
MIAKVSFRRLSGYRRRLHAFMRGKMNVHFLHLRKTGGTAIKSALTSQLLTPNAVLHLHPHRITLNHIPRGHRIVFVTRNPVRRFVSGFTSRFNQGAPAHHVPWTPAEAIAFTLFPDPNSLALALDPAHPLHREALDAVKSISHIRCSYWDWFHDEAAFQERMDDILFIGRTEQLDDDFQTLKTLLELPDHLELPRDPAASNRGTPQPLEPRAIEILRSWHSADYRFLECCETWRNRASHG